MAKINSFADVNRALRKIESSFKSISTAKVLGNQGKDIIFKRVKQGFGVTSQTSKKAKRKKLKVLSPSYIRQRKRNGVHGQFGSPSFSNLTNTGQMLDSIQVKTDRGGFTLLIPNSRRKDGKTNSDVAQFVTDQGRAFFNFTQAEARILEQTAQQIINKIVKTNIG